LHSEYLGGTVPSYRLASQREKRKWKIFREELDKSERKTFDEMISYSRLYKTAGVMLEDLSYCIQSYVYYFLTL
jgi:ABC-type uncharacterized transport system ATPase subunit